MFGSSKKEKCMLSTCPLGGAQVHVNVCKHSLPLSATGCCNPAAQSTHTLAPHWSSPLGHPPSPADTNCFLVSSLCYFTCIVEFLMKNWHIPSLQWQLWFWFHPPSLAVSPLVWRQTWMQHGRQVGGHLWEETEQSSRAWPTSWSSWKTWTWQSSEIHRRRHPQFGSLLGEVWSTPWIPTQHKCLVNTKYTFKWPVLQNQTYKANVQGNKTALTFTNMTTHFPRILLIGALL